MEIDETLVRHLANLSRLYFSPDEMIFIQADLQSMIGFVEKLNELDTRGIEPLRHMSYLEDIFRSDVSATPISSDKSLFNAKGHDNQFFQVPKVIS